MSPCLYFKDGYKKYLLVVRTDPYRGIVNPYFLEVQQKYVVGGDNWPYATQTLSIIIYAVIGSNLYGLAIISKIWGVQKWNQDSNQCIGVADTNLNIWISYRYWFSQKNKKQYTNTNTDYTDFIGLTLAVVWNRQYRWSMYNIVRLHICWHQ